MKPATYRKMNDRSQNSSKYHKKDGTAVRAKLKAELVKETKTPDGIHENLRRIGCKPFSF
jgi:hypothetical protein